MSSDPLSRAKQEEVDCSSRPREKYQTSGWGGGGNEQENELKERSDDTKRFTRLVQNSDAL